MAAYIVKNMAQVLMIQDVNNLVMSYVIKIEVITHWKMMIQQLNIIIAFIRILDMIIIILMKQLNYFKNVQFLVYNAIIIIDVYQINVMKKIIISQLMVLHLFV